MYAKTCNSSHVARPRLGGSARQKQMGFGPTGAAAASLPAAPSPGVGRHLDGANEAGALPPVSKVIRRSTGAPGQRPPSFRWSSRALRNPLAA
jgi:hypothetical protein